MKQTELTAVILCGGKNRRFPTEKSLLVIDDTVLIKKIYSICADIFYKVIIITAKSEIINLFEGDNCLPDIKPNYGSLGGIYSAISYSETSHVFVFACDMPLISKECISEQLAYFLKHNRPDVLMPIMDDNIEPLHAIYSKNCLNYIENNLINNDLRIKNFFQEVKSVYWKYPLKYSKSFFNINTHEDWIRYKNEQ